VAVALAACALGGCLSFSGSEPVAAPPAPSPRLAPYAITWRVSDFTFADNDGEPRPSHVDGWLLAGEITDSWKERGLIRHAQRAEPTQPWPGDFFYALTFSGKQRNDSNFWLQGFNTLTVFLLPYPITHHYEIECLAEDVATGAQYHATVTGSSETWVTLPFLLAFPFKAMGHEAEMRNVADRLYQELSRLGAFRATPQSGSRTSRVTSRAGEVRRFDGAAANLGLGQSEF
jgi:hypothetical protein